jgi:hypothetical protein
MKTQAQAYWDWMQLRLHDPNFVGMAFANGAILSPIELMRIETPEELMAIVQEAALRAQAETN